MYELAKIKSYKTSNSSTQLIIELDNKNIPQMILNKNMRQLEVRFDDGRTITNEQRKKAYATISDIAKWTGYLPEEAKEQLKYLYVTKTGGNYISLGNCTMDEAREFINTIIEFAIENGIQLEEQAVNRTDDIDQYLYYCLKYKKCAVCGIKGEIHHWDAIGMGNDRTKYDDSDNRKICLCRTHHTIAHQRGRETFENMYKVYGIKYTEKEG